jgi:hypothetical protein
MKNSGLPTMVEAKSNIPKHITNTLPKGFKTSSSQNSSLNLISPNKTSLSTQQILKRKLEERQTVPIIPKKEKKVWNCIEERIQNKTEFGTTIRKIIFGDVYIDEISALSKKPFEDFANLRVGHKVWYYDKTGKIVDGSFICSSKNHKFDSKWMIVDLLQNENDLKYFCSTNNISFTSTFSMVIEAYNFFVNLQSRYRLDNCGTDQSEIGQLETMLEYPMGKIARLQGNTDSSDTVEIDFGTDKDEMYIKNELVIEELSGEADIEMESSSINVQSTSSVQQTKRNNTDDTEVFDIVTDDRIVDDDNFFTTNNDMNVKKPTVKTKEKSSRKNVLTDSISVTHEETTTCSSCNDPCNVLHADPPICYLCIEDSEMEKVPNEILALLRNNFYTLKDKSCCVGCGSGEKYCGQETILGCPKCKKPRCRKKATLKCNKCYES